MRAALVLVCVAGLQAQVTLSGGVQVSGEARQGAEPAVSNSLNLVFDGDSWMCGYPWGTCSNALTPDATSAPSKLAEQLITRPIAAARNVATSGAALQYPISGPNLVTRAAGLVDVLIDPTKTNVLVFQAGANDIIVGLGGTLTTAFTTYLTARRAAGWKIIVTSIGPVNFAGDTYSVGSSCGIIPSFDTNGVACNVNNGTCRSCGYSQGFRTWLFSHANLYDGFYDLNHESELQNLYDQFWVPSGQPGFGHPSRTGGTANGIVWSGAPAGGYGVIAKAIAQAINALYP
jgi:lysophospholipase L1-like esterase